MEKQMSEPRQPPDDMPFVIEEDGYRAVVRFAQIGDHERTAELRKQLFDVVDKTSQIVCDLGQTGTIVSGWLRLLENLTERAEASGKRFVLASVRPSVRETSDIIGVGKRLVFVNSIEEGWEK